MAAFFKFGNWVARPADNLLCFDGNEKHIEPKAMELLIILAKADGELVSRQQIQETIWHGRFVADHSLYNLISLLRKTLDDDPENPQYIDTRPKKGYRLVPKVEWLESKSAATEKSVESVRNRSYYALGALALISVIFIWSFSAFVIKDDQLNIESSIAVLPFDVFDGQETTRYFADGLAEEIIHQLTVVPDVKVISRTSSFSFRDKNASINAIADQLKVAWILEGSVRKEQNMLRITMQLIKATDGTHLWSKVFNAVDGNIFSLQQDISDAVVESVSHKQSFVSQKQIRIHPNSGDAYIHYLRGRALNTKGTSEGYELALKEFQQAVELSPEYALAHAAVAFNYLLLHQYKGVPLEQVKVKALQAIEHALEIDPELAEAYAASGLYYIYSDDFVLAEQAFNRALSLNPNSAVVRHNMGFMYWQQGRKKEALIHHRAALSVNPFSAISNFAVADGLTSIGHLNKALRQFQHCMLLFPKYLGCGLGLANFYRLTNRMDEAQTLMEQVSQHIPATNSYLRSAWAVQYVWNDEIDKAVSFFSESFVNDPTVDLNALHLVKLRSGEAVEWEQVLQTVLSQNPNNPNIKVASAMAAYQLNHCAKAIQLYESLFNQHPNFNFRGSFHNAAIGISHIANMAYCYQKLGQLDKANENVALLKQNLDELQLDKHIVPGAMLLKAKYALLVGKPHKAQHLVTEIKQLKWPLVWLINTDPAFK
ncbi:winged helix-turn-helix domain-containing protein [Paraglaciecola arctica]|uniref:winged helix-turn-helix domain-containing protein n=1 Tax=Paraglaciecola arctica TaxID=1128911 RepID=UPI001C07B410|nr:winged helix-turn-helix domain-containing protein [Paraglaciecola arctica]MBU3003331.1 winged helix-turn-helix domain-containing protein [Paraglaciecola arctica]